MPRIELSTHPCILDCASCRSCEVGRYTQSRHGCCSSLCSTGWLAQPLESGGCTLKGKRRCDSHLPRFMGTIQIIGHLYALLRPFICGVIPCLLFARVLVHGWVCAPETSYQTMPEIATCKAQLTSAHFHLWDRAEGCHAVVRFSVLVVGTIWSPMKHCSCAASSDSSSQALLTQSLGSLL